MISESEWSQFLLFPSQLYLYPISHRIVFVFKSQFSQFRLFSRNSEFISHNSNFSELPISCNYSFYVLFCVRNKLPYKRVLFQVSPVFSAFDTGGDKSVSSSSCLQHCRRWWIATQQTSRVLGAGGEGESINHRWEVLSHHRCSLPLISSLSFPQCTRCEPQQIFLSSQAPEEINTLSSKGPPKLVSAEGLFRNNFEVHCGIFKWGNICCHINMICSNSWGFSQRPDETSYKS